MWTNKQINVQSQNVFSQFNCECKHILLSEQSLFNNKSSWTNANLDLLLLSGFLGHILVFAMVYKSDQSWVDNFVNFVTKK